MASGAATIHDFLAAHRAEEERFPAELVHDPYLATEVVALADLLSAQ